MSLRDRCAWLVLTFGGSGASPVAPGTAGSLAAVLVAFLLWRGGVREPWVLPAMAVAIGVLHMLVGRRIAPIFGKPDPGHVVSDEACGQWLTLSVPVAAGLPDWLVLATGFVLFRVFDITKPPGVREFDRRHDAFGVLFDDVVAGVYAGVVLYVLSASGALSAVASIVG